MKVYRGAAAGARLYVEHGRSRPDDYYLAEGTGIARRFAAIADGRATELQVMDGDAYESWVSGFDPATGQPRGRLRNDEHAVRFVEVTVNGPKSWSIAAELHPDVAVAYEAAQDRAAAQITGWLAGNATARVGPRGAQVAAPVELIEAATIRHYTSRAGDPHRHLHIQINSRVLADGKWRGIDTVAVRDSLNAINGIGRAAVVCDPEFRAALSSHGYTLNMTGEIEQLAAFVGPFSKRAAQIEANVDRYAREWTEMHPNEQPGPGLRRAWDARAWAEGRPDKVIPEPGAEIQARWLAELVALGYRDDDRPIQLALPLAGQIDRDRASAEIVLRLGAARSSWNAADVRGEVEHLLSRAELVADAAVRRELAEDLTARALADSMPLLDREVPAHVRALTAQHVLDVEADLVGRLAVRGAEPCEPLEVVGVAPAGRALDDAQAAAAAVLAGTAALVVIEGAAGAGKTTTLSLTRRLLDQQGRWLVVVTPTLKAAQVAAAELGTQAGSAAWLAHQYGWRWDDTGRWTRLRPLDTDPATGRQYLGPTRAATLRRGDLLLVDEAAMLDQDTARALLTIADEHGARFALVGDRHQLPAVGRGGVLDLAHRWADPSACVTLDQVHRFTATAIVDGKPVTVADIEYAQLTLAMSGGDAAEGVFDALHDRGQVRIHPTEADRLADVVDTAAAQRGAGRSCAVVVDTREQAAQLNTAIRERLIAAGVVDDRQGTTAGGGERVGVGDTVATRRNDCDLGVANRDTWTVAAVHADGSLTVGRPGADQRQLPKGYVRAHVELAYATTPHGAQGDTTTTADLILGEHTTAAAAYVGMTRGREGNIAHLVAADLDEARQQWSAAFGRDRADLGPAHAREAAERDAAGYAPPAPRPDPAAGRLDAVLAELAAAWTEQQNAHLAVAHLQHKLDGAQRDADRRDAYEAIVGRARTDMISRRQLAEQATRYAEASRVTLRAAAEQLGVELHALWDADLKVAGDAARTVAAGPGRLRHRRGQVRDARELLDTWAEKWRPVLDVTAGSGGAAGFAIRQPGTERVEEPLTAYVRTLAEAQCPHDAAVVRTAVRLRDAARAAADRYGRAVKRADETIGWDRDHGYYPRADELPDLADRACQAQQRANAADTRVDRLRGDPALAGQPDPSGFLASAHNRWAVAREAALTAATQRARLTDATRIATPARFHRVQFDPPPTVDHGPSMGR